jgi:thiamine-monophosphate kinase
MIDISDGLASEARHLAAASNAVIEIELERLPCIDGVAPGEAARSGEEYELLLTAPPDLETESFRTRFGVSLARIGRVSTRGRADVLFLLHGARVDVGSGYDHFSA